MTKFGKQWSYYLRAPILGEFDKRCDSCKDKRSDTNVEIDPYGSQMGPHGLKAMKILFSSSNWLFFALGLKNVYILD